MPRDHVGSVAVGTQGALNGQIGRQHRRLRVFRLFEFVLRFLELFFAQRRAENETGERLAAKNLHHGLIGLAPNLCGGREALNQIGGHAHVLTALAGVHVNGFCLGWHGGLVGHEDALSLQEAPFFCVKHRLTSERLAFGEFRPRGGDQRHAEGCFGVKRRTGGFKRGGQTKPTGIIIKQRPLEGNGLHGLVQGFQRRSRQQHQTALNSLDFIVGHGRRQAPIENGRG